MNKTALITGANAGLGRATAFALAERGYRVILACRNLANAKQTADDIQTKIPASAALPWQLDLASLAQIRESASGIMDGFHQIDLLINNAGVFTPPLTRTEDGFELQFGVNHLGHFAFTLALRKLFSDDVRVVNISSSAHRISKIDWDNLNAERRYSRAKAYGQSKLANLLFTLSLQSRLAAPAMSVAVHPGYVTTKLHAHLVVTKISNLFMGLSPEEAAKIVIMAALHEVPPGSYVGPKGVFGIQGEPSVIEPSAAALDEANAERLWQISEELTGYRW